MIRDEVLGNLAKKHKFTGSKAERDRLFASLDAYGQVVNREKIYDRAIKCIREGNNKEGLELLNQVAKDEHPVACVLLWIYYEKIKNNELSKQYKIQSEEFFQYIEEKAHNVPANKLSADFFIALYWGYKHKLNKQELINEDYSSELTNMLGQLFSNSEEKEEDSSLSP